MGQIRDQFDQAFRDYESDGVPASGPYEPIKADIRALGNFIEAAVSSAGTNLTAYATVAAMEAVEPDDAGTLAYVYDNNGSPSDPLNGPYQWSGTDWEPAAWLYAQLAAIVQPLVDEAEAAATAATDALADIIAIQDTLIGYAEFPTRDAALDGGLLNPAIALIQSDDDVDGNPTVNLFDGWDFRIISELAFSPKTLFANSETGFIIDGGDKSAMWQDRVFATPVTAHGQPVAVVLDKTVARPKTIPTRRNTSYATDDPKNGFLAGLTAFEPQYAVAPPYAGTVAHKAIEDSSNGGHVFYKNVAHDGGNVVYWRPMKAGERGKCRLTLTPSAYSDFDLGAGTVLGNGGGATGAILALGDGWYRCAVSANLGATTLQVATYILDGTGDDTYLGDNTKGLYFAGEQVEDGTAPSAYQRVGSNVAGWLPGNVFSNDDDDLRPTFVIDGDKRGLRFSAHALWSDALNLRTADGVVTLALAGRLAATGTTAALISGAPTGPGAYYGGPEIFANNVTVGAIGAGVGAHGAYRFVNGPDTVTPRDFVILVTFDPTAADAADRIRMQVNGAPVSGSVIAAVGSMLGVAAADVRTMSFGARVPTGPFAGFDLYAGVGINRELTSTEALKLSAWLGAKADVPTGGELLFSHEPGAADFADTPTPDYDSDNGVYQTASFARMVYDTSAVALEITSFNNTFSTFPGITELAVMVDGAFYGTVQPGADGEVANLILLPEGLKRVEIVNGFQSVPGSELLGVWLKSVRADAALTPYAVPPRTTRRLIYGDSISEGANANPITRYGYPLQVRGLAHAQTIIESVGVEAFGYRSLRIDAMDAPSRAAFVARIVAWNPTHLWMAIGTNDYGLNLWTAAAFQTAYAALLTDLHAALPALEIVVQSPVDRASEIANGLGDSLGAYRTAAQNACTGKAWVTYIDGAAILTTAELDDGVHPDNDGHDLIAAAVEAEWGL